MTIPKFIKEHAKTVVAFVATFVGNAIVSLLNGDTAWPQTKDEWLQYALTSVGAAVSVWLARNKITQKQLDKDPNVVGGTVVPDAQTPNPVTGETPWVP
jgi:lipopolysaccharide export LptBFGC system permease protein LptF